MCGSMVDIQFPTAEIRQGGKRRRNHSMKIYMACPITYGNHKQERGPMPNVMAALPNIGGALCSTPQCLAELECHAVTLPRCETH